MLYREKIAVCSEIHTKHIGQIVVLLNVEPPVQKKTKINPFPPNVHQFSKDYCFCKFPTLRLFVLLTTATCKLT